MSNARKTKALVKGFVAPGVADIVIGFVGENSMRNAAELRQLAKEGRESLWEAFVDNVLAPHAKHGKHMVTLPNDVITRNFTGWEDEDVEDLFKSKAPQGFRVNKHKYSWTIHWG
mmetsp:Transcript_92834/g.267026  ORF Transcript_92834/g.267026 Transcript_92834/m.267026 type:complete len:115 (-) Transcript_92834:196-540(-)